MVRHTLLSLCVIASVASCASACTVLFRNTRTGTYDAYAGQPVKHTRNCFANYALVVWARGRYDRTTPTLDIGVHGLDEACCVHLDAIDGVHALTLTYREGAKGPVHTQTCRAPRVGVCATLAEGVTVLGAEIT